MARRDAKPPSKYPLGKYGLSIALLVLFLVSWVAQFVSQIVEVENQAEQHGESFAWSDFFPSFLQATFENWQSEFLQLLTFVVLTTYLVHQQSHESRDTDDEMTAALERIEARLEGLEQKAGVG